MRVKELKRTVNVSWSPGDLYPIYLAAGSAAQQVDASFSSNSQLELYALNLEEPGLDLELKCSLPTKNKFHKLVWSGAGVLVAGCDSGRLEFYSQDRLLSGGGDALMTHSDKHNGNVSALDVNPYQKNLVASGAGDSEILIWDLGHTAQPMTPGGRSQPQEHVQAVAWNQQVQHILGSTFATRCVVWDLRKNEPIMKLSDSQSRTQWRALSWHPSVATQLCVASELDQGPVVQLWDLRLAASPLVTLEGHQKGVMSLSWCNQDPDLLLSAGKDGRVLCWNPNNTTPGGELLCELSTQPQWVFDVQWCPRDPTMFVSAAFDSHTSVHAVLGGNRPDTSVHNTHQILDSFGAAPLSALPAVTRANDVISAAPTLPRPPKWMAKPRGVKFGFGGKLVSFDKCPEGQTQRIVTISQVVSEPEIVERASELDSVLGLSLSQDPQAADTLAEYCRCRSEQCPPSERSIWMFLRASFLPTFRHEVLSLLGYKPDEIPNKFKTPNNNVAGDMHNDSAQLSRTESTETEAELSTDTSSLSDAHTLIERKLANLEIEPNVTNIAIPHGEDTTSLICRALVCGNLEEAVELCLDDKRTADALIIASLGSQELVYKVQRYHLQQTASDPVSLLANSLLSSGWDTLVQAARTTDWRDVLAALVTHTEGEALAHYCEMLGDKLSSSSDPSLTSAATICYLVALSCDALVARCDSMELTQHTELALLVRTAARARGRGDQSVAKLESLLSEYALRLASQGCLHSALITLEGTQAELKERLLYALGMVRRQSHQAPISNRTRTTSNQSKRGHLVAHSDVSHTYSAVPPAYEQQSPWSTSSVPAPGGHQPAPQPQTAPPTQPARPTSVGSAGAATRNKYKVDPSVQSAPLYNQYSFNQSQPFTEQFNPTPASYNPTPSTYNPANPGTYNPNPASFNPINPAPVNPTNAVNGGYYNSEPAPAPSKPVAPGWNDPPMQMNKPKPKQEIQAQAPITHPLFGVEPPQHIPLNPAPAYPGQQQYPGQTQQYPAQTQQYPGQTQQYPGQTPQYPVQTQQFPGQTQQYPGQPQQFPGQNQYPAQQYPGYQEYSGQQQFAQQGYPQQTSSPAPAPAPKPPTPAPKPPLEGQLASLQQCLDNLLHACQERATHPQMKRKLEDVHKRLETLYDLLREYRLSDSAIAALQQCCALSRTCEWDNASAVAASLAQGADFASAASFLPGLKVLFQLSQQLQVTVG